MPPILERWLSAAIALASTTFLGNAIAGLMIRAVGDFSPGDFIHVGEHFGRVSERGLLHVEIQTEARDLVTVPNLHVASHPVTVVRASGTVIDADVYLGYDVDHTRAVMKLGDPISTQVEAGHRRGRVPEATLRP